MADLTWNRSWDSTILYEDQLLPNTYNISVDFNVLTDDGEDQNISMDRLKYFIDTILQDGVFCKIDDSRASIFVDIFKQRLVTFVLQPQDLVVASTLFSKFTKIVEGKLEIECIRLSSSQGDGVTVNFDEEFAEEGTMLKDHELLKATDISAWWFRGDCGTADYFKLSEDGALTFITDITDWDDAGLSWNNSSDKDKKDERAWNPTIIPGGKTQH